MMSSARRRRGVGGWPNKTVHFGQTGGAKLAEFAKQGSCLSAGEHERDQDGWLHQKVAWDRLVMKLIWEFLAWSFGWVVLVNFSVGWFLKNETSEYVLQVGGVLDVKMPKRQTDGAISSIS